jgi:hypothetical protein
MCTILVHSPEPEFGGLLRSPEIDFQPGGPVRKSYLTYRLYRVAESSNWNRFLGSLNVYKFGLWHEIMKEMVEEEKKRLRRH